MATVKKKMASKDEVGPGNRPLRPGQLAIQPKFTGPRLDETVHGGFYMDEFGMYKDAEGNEVETEVEHEHDKLVDEHDAQSEKAEAEAPKPATVVVAKKVPVKKGAKK